MREDPYRDALAPGWRLRGTIRPQPVPADPGTVFEDAVSGWVGAVLTADSHQMRLEDRHGETRLFPLGGGYLIDGRPVKALPPTRPNRTPATRRTASGSVAAPEHRARVARASRIWVEGTHDAELLERVWGDDLREAAVVVEPIGGVDRLADRLAVSPPTQTARVGMLVDHLVAGSKETRLAQEATRSVPTGTLLVVGHPYIDVWQAVRPAALGIEAWPIIPQGTEWKRGICAAFGWPGQTQEDIHDAWRRILSGVHRLTDLEPAFAGRVEELIDFVTAPPSGSED
ncbi:MAG: DUF3097 domain-containing protein [Microbacteriaceae bacterium]|jgi:hypothetical protein|nr:DUF3097 domain-containing protein [Microbacteriaceae bacterium]MCI1207021.1 DUF3097 domain-containing protein [Microbacteriaceae bacterium]